MDLTTREKSELLDYFLELEGIQSPQPQGIRQRENRDELPLSFGQERLWFLYQLQPESACYNEPAAVRLTGSLNVAALEQGINEIVRRHEVLRTVFISVDGGPVQVIREKVDVPLPLVDLQRVPKDEQNRAIDKLALGEYQQPFDFAHGPLMRVRLLRLAQEEHVLLLTMHHAVSDGWSVGVFFNELAALYGAFCLGKPSPLPELPIQYVDYAHWQRQSFHGESLHKPLAYWKDHLGGGIPNLELPADRPRPPVQTFRGARLYFSLPPSLAEALRALSRQENATLFMVLLGAFQALLYRYTGQDDVVVGSPIAGRNWPEVEGLIGCFLNTLVLRTDLSGNPSFRALLARVRDVATGAYTYQDLPFEKLVEELHPERETSRNPLFQVMFVLQNSLSLQLPGLSLTPEHLDRGAVPLDLILSMEETSQGLGGWWEYNTDLFDATTIARLAGHLQVLLEGVVANPDQRLSDLPLLTEAERNQVLVAWDDRRRPYPHDARIQQLFEVQAEVRPNAVAVADGEALLTYRQLNQRSNQLAHHLRGLGVGPEVLVAMYTERSLEMVVGILGVLKAGGAYVPMDPTYPSERLAFMLEDTQAPVLLTQQSLRAALPKHTAHVICLDADWETIAQERDDNPIVDMTPNSSAYVIYTSGSTGKPKGVSVTHYNVVRLFAATQAWYQFDAKDVWTLFHSYAFDFSVWELWGALLYGGRLVVVPYWVSRSPDAFYELLGREQVTVLNQTPSAFHQLMQAEAHATVVEKLGLRLVIFGGEALELQSLQPWFARHGDRCPQLVNMYGITETTVHVTYRPITADDLGRAAGSMIGRAIPDLQVYILDQHRQLVPIGVPGEMYVGGGGVARGYLHRADLTADRFLPDPFSNDRAARLYKTGDSARYLLGGDIEYLGRLDQQVKIRGFRIELGEIEAVLAQQPAVREAVVLAREDSPGDKRLVAYVVAKESVPSVTSLRDFLKEALPDYMVPAAFVMLDALPLTTNGKIDRQALPAPDTSRPELAEAFVAPSDALEFQLTQVWGKVLGLQPISVRDNFFELGGHSLLAVRLLARIEKIAGMKLPLVTLFQAPTIEQLAAVLRQKEWKAPWSPLVAMQPQGSKPPFFCVHAAAGNVLFYSDLARHLGLDQPFYGLQARGLDGDALPHHQMEDMAAHYIEEIRTVQPKGPYFLGGLSFGGTVAYEMAQQLQAQGEKVGLLVLFDTCGPGYPQISMGRLARDKIKRGAVRIYNNMRKLMRLDLKGQAAFALEKVEIVKKRTKTKAKKRVHRTKESILTVVCNLYIKIGLPLPPALRYLRVREADHEAQKTYMPRPYTGQVTLFRAAKQPLGCYPDAKLGWGSLVNGHMEIYEIPGSHSHTLVRDPQAQLVVEKLKPCLSRAQAMEVT